MSLAGSIARGAEMGCGVVIGTNRPCGQSRRWRQWPCPQAYCPCCCAGCAQGGELRCARQSDSVERSYAAAGLGPRATAADPSSIRPPALFPPFSRPTCDPCRRRMPRASRRCCTGRESCRPGSTRSWGCPSGPCSSTLRAGSCLRGEDRGERKDG